MDRVTIWSTGTGRFRISFLSVEGILYGVRYATALNQTRWTPAPLAMSETNSFQTTLIEGNGDWLSQYAPGNLRDAFFRPTVEHLDTYHLSATSFVTSLTAQDSAANSSQPISHFQLGDNGGVNLLPWVQLEGTARKGSHFLGGSIAAALTY